MGVTSKELLQDIQSGKNKSFCVMPWIGFSASMNSQFHLCCLSESTKISNKKTSIEKYKISGVLRNIRKKMLKGEKIDICKYCYNQESLKLQSYRLSRNSFYQKYIKDIVYNTYINSGLTNFGFKYIDIRFSNICNLACRMCTGHNSSGRVALDQALGSPKMYKTIIGGNWNKEYFFQSKNFLEGLEEIYIAGGEPFLDRDQKAFTDMLMDNGNHKSLNITFNTNLTIIDKNWIQKLLGFNNIHIIISCDGYQEVFEYIRIGAKWEVFLKNLVYLYKLQESHPNLKLSVHSVIQRDNVVNFLKLYIFFKKYFSEVNMIRSTLITPEYLAIKNMEVSDKQDILKIYKRAIITYKDQYPEIECDLQEVIHVLENEEPSEEHNKEYYRTKPIIDKYMLEYTSQK